MAGASAGNVDAFNVRMLTEIRTDIGPAPDDLQCAKKYKRFKCHFKKIRQVIVHRVHLQNDGGVFDE